jgi:hypothetical protein
VQPIAIKQNQLQKEINASVKPVTHYALGTTHFITVGFNPRQIAEGQKSKSQRQFESTRIQKLF